MLFTLNLYVVYDQFFIWNRQVNILLSTTVAICFILSVLYYKLLLSYPVYPKKLGFYCHSVLDMAIEVT